MKFHSILTLFVLSLTAFGSAQPRYQILDLGVLPGSTRSAACGVGQDGAVLGYCPDTSTPWRWTVATGMQRIGDRPGFGQTENVAGQSIFHFNQDFDYVRQPVGSFVTINRPPNILYSEPLDINTSGVVVLRGEVDNGLGRPFTWTAVGGPVSLPMPQGATSAAGYSINAQGDVVGAFRRDDVAHPILWEGGQMLVPALPFGEVAAGFRSINDSGLVCGQVFRGAYAFPFLWDRATGYQMIPVPKNVIAAYAMSINNLGVVTGTAYLSDSDRFIRVFVYSRSWGFRFLDKLILNMNSDFSAMETQSINHAGQIAGSLVGKNFEHAFLATPVR